MPEKIKCCIATADPEDYDVILRSELLREGELDGGKLVTTGDALLLSAANDRTSIAVVDAQLPGLNAFDAISMIRSQKALQAVVILPEERYDLAYRALKAHACELLVRPLTTEAVSAALRCAIEHHRASQTDTVPERTSSRSAFVNLLDTVLDGRTPIEDLNKSYNTRFRQGLFRVVTFTVDFPDTSQINELIRQVWHSIRSILEPKLSSHVYDMLHALVYNEIRIVFNYPADSESIVLQSLNETLRAVEEICRTIPGSGLYMGVGRSYDDINRLGASSEESKASVWTRMARTRDPNKIYRFSNSQKLPDHYLHTITELEAGLRKSMEDLNLRIFTQLVDTFFDLPEEVLCTPEAKDAILRPVRFFYHTYRQKMESFTSAPTFYYSTKMTLLSSRSFEEYKSRYIACFTPMFERLLSTLHSAQHSSLDRAKEFIAHHYMEELSLQRVADEVLLNPSYLSRLFRRETGLTFTDYCLTQRMNAAKSLLKRTDYRVKEISASVGYTDSRYFSRLFMEHVGMTPTAYRKVQRTSYVTEENPVLPD